MRGSQQFALLFAEEAPAPGLKAVPRSGRDAELVEDRNELLLHRYYWHSSREIEPGVRMGFESLLKLLSAEFFLTKRRITDIIEDNAAEIKRIRNEHADMGPAAVARKFSRQWSWLNW